MWLWVFFYLLIFHASTVLVFPTVYWHDLKSLPMMFFRSCHSIDYIIASPGDQLRCQELVHVRRTGLTPPSHLLIHLILISLNSTHAPLCSVAPTELPLVLPLSIHNALLHGTPPCLALRFRVPLIIITFLYDISYLMYAYVIINHIRYTMCM